MCVVALSEGMSRGGGVQRAPAGPSPCCSRAPPSAGLRPSALGLSVSKPAAGRHTAVAGALEQTEGVMTSVASWEGKTMSYRLL